ncbi:MAG: hypothetical protein ABSF77_17555 [Spirochaetia bacterium]
MLAALAVWLVLPDAPAPAAALEPGLDVLAAVVAAAPLPDVLAVVAAGMREAGAVTTLLPAALAPEAAPAAVFVG